jgi:hypothetical protein
LLTLVAIALILFGIINIWVAFMRNTPTIGPLVVGVAFVALGMYVMPADNDDKTPEIYYRK